MLRELETLPLHGHFCARPSRMGKWKMLTSKPRISPFCPSLLLSSCIFCSFFFPPCCRGVVCGIFFTINPNIKPCLNSPMADTLGGVYAPLPHGKVRAAARPPLNDSNVATQSLFMHHVSEAALNYFFNKALQCQCFKKKRTRVLSSFNCWGNGTAYLWDTCATDENSMLSH